MSANLASSEKAKDEVKGETKVILAAQAQTSVIINAANIIDNADSQLFPTLANQIQSSLGIKEAPFTAIVTARSLLQAVSTPIWGWWNDKHSRKKVLAFGVAFWGLFTLLTAFAVNYISLFWFRAITGIGLAVIIPTTQSLVADYYPAAKRGKMFGWLGLTGIIGIIFGTLFATIMVESNALILGMEAWRFVFVVWAIISFAIALLIWFFAKDPPRGQWDGAAGTSKRTMKLGDFKTILTNRTFMFIVAEGVAGSIPWNGILLMVSWLEFIGFSSTVSGLVFALVAAGSALGNLFGGWIGDRAAKWNPDKGRIAICQISVACGLPLTWVIFFVIPPATSSIMLYIVLGAITGFLISWCGACNNVIFSEVFEPEIRGSMYSVDRVFEGSLASFGTLFVGLLAQYVFGYLQIPQGSYEINTLPATLRAANASALAQGMFWVCFIPWVLCLILYTLVYFTYPKDRQHTIELLQARAGHGQEAIRASAEEAPQPTPEDAGE
jgi:MFS family permease